MYCKYKNEILILFISIVIFSCTFLTDNEPYIEPTYYLCLNNLDGDDQTILFEKDYSGSQKMYLSNSDHVGYLSDTENVFFVNVETLDTLNFTCEPDGFAISPNGETVIYQQENTFYKYNTSSGETNLLLEFSNYWIDVSYPHFSPDNEKLIFFMQEQNISNGNYTKNIITYDMDEGILDTLHTIVSGEDTFIKMPRFSSNCGYIYFEYDTSIYKKELTNLETFCIYQFGIRISDYTFSENENYLIVKTAYDTYYLTSDGMDIRMIKDGHNHTFLTDQQILYSYNGIYIYNVNSGIREEIIERTRGVGYLKERDQIVYIRGINE